MKAEELGRLEQIIDACDCCQASLRQWVPPVEERATKWTTRDRELFERLDRIQTELILLIYRMDPMLEAMARTLQQR